jgi:hypothetical protein
LMRSVGSEGGSVWECSFIAGDPLSSKGSGTERIKDRKFKGRKAHASYSTAAYSFK